MNPIGILGGTFDPVHNGHLRLAIEMREALGLSKIKLIPASIPPLRNAPDAAAPDRLRMLKVAIEGENGLEIDNRELEREGTSYTVDTLRSLRKELGSTPLCLIVGMDAFRRLNEWHQWEALVTLAHIAVAQRPGSERPASGAVARLAEERGVDNPSKLHEREAGHLIFCQIPALQISATRIRTLLADGRSIRYLVPDRVNEILKEGEQYHA